jgi:hypothetical protein
MIILITRVLEIITGMWPSEREGDRFATIMAANYGPVTGKPRYQGLLSLYAQRALPLSTRMTLLSSGRRSQIGKNGRASLQVASGQDSKHCLIQEDTDRLQDSAVKKPLSLAFRLN